MLQVLSVYHFDLLALISFGFSFYSFKQKKIVQASFYSTPPTIPAHKNIKDNLFLSFFLVVRHLRCLRLGNIYKKDNKYQYQYHQSDTNTNRVHNSMPFLSFWWHLVTLNSQLPTNRPCSTSPSQAVCSW